MAQQLFRISGLSKNLARQILKRTVCDALIPTLRQMQTHLPEANAHTVMAFVTKNVAQHQVNNWYVLDSTSESFPSNLRGNGWLSHILQHQKYLPQQWKRANSAGTQGIIGDTNTLRTTKTMVCPNMPEWSTFSFY
jgi:hypothetical protein